MGYQLAMLLDNPGLLWTVTAIIQIKRLKIASREPILGEQLQNRLNIFRGTSTNSYRHGTARTQLATSLFQPEDCQVPYVRCHCVSANPGQHGRPPRFPVPSSRN